MHRTTPRPQRWAITVVGVGAAFVSALALAGVAAAKDRVTATIQNSTLTITGTDAADALTLRLRAGDPTTLQIVTGGGGRIEVKRNRFDQIEIEPGAGSDSVRIDDVNGPFTDTEATIVRGGTGNDTLVGGLGAETLFGQAGNDTIRGGAGGDVLHGGDDADSLTGGAGGDQVFGGPGSDRMIWGPGDDTDVNEGGDGEDTVVVDGGSEPEQFTTTANGERVRFDRLSPTAGFVDIGTSEHLAVNMNGGNDSFSAVGNLAALIKISVDGGDGADTILGSNGADQLHGGDGDDFLDGQQGNDVAFLGTGDDTFQWDPGDGSDTIEGQAGNDRLRFNGSSGSEAFEASANGGRVRFTRNLGTIVTDLDDVERMDVNAFGGTDTLVVNDLTGTDLADIDVDLALAGGAGDGAADTVIVNGSNGADQAHIVGSGSSASVLGLVARVDIANAEGAADALVLNALGGADGVSAATLPSGVLRLTLDGGAGDDSLLGSQGADVFLGGSGDDDVAGNEGADTALLGADDDLFRWEPGDGNDTVEGQSGLDTSLFTGSADAESVQVAANGGRVLFWRSLESVSLDLDDVESLGFRALDGADDVVVGDLAGTDVTAVELDLRGASGSADGAADTVSVHGTQGSDVFGAAGDAGGVTAFGLHASVEILAAEQATDRLMLNALGGDDVVDATALEADGIPLTMNGGLGEDVLLGGDGGDLVTGGDGSDIALLGAGDDTFAWNPGDDSDVVEGQAGADTMLFNGANVAENVHVSANGGRILFFRDIASVVMDLNDVESISYNAFGGADTLVVNDLSGTDATRVEADLAAPGGVGDGAIDSVLVIGTNGDDSVETVGDSSGVAVTGLAARVHVDGAEAANDKLTIKALAGVDVVDARGLAAGAITLVADGGTGGDQLLGGAGDNLLLGGEGDDRLGPGGGMNMTEGGEGVDTVVVDGGSEPEQFTTTANGERVRFDRLSPTAGFVDIGTSEHLVVNMNGGNDSFSAVGNLAALIKISVDGGDGADTILGSNGADQLHGGDGDDFLDGQQGNDVAFLGTGDDTFQWDPGDGSDTIEGQAGNDRLRFNGSNGSEAFEASANGGRVRFTRNLGTIVTDLDDVERMDVNAFGGTDTLVVNDLTGTDLADIDVDLALAGGAGDGAADAVVLNGTASPDTVAVTGSGPVVAAGLAASVSIAGSEAANDTLRIQTFGGDDTVTVAPEVSGAIGPVVDLGADD